MKTKRLETGVRKEQIAEAALEIVSSKGIQGLSVHSVAKEVEIVPSAIYRHFNSKADIIEAVLDLIRKRLHSNFQNIIDLDADPLKKLCLLMNRHFDLIRANSAIPGIVFSGEVMGGQQDKRRQLYGIIENVITNVSTIVTQGQENGSIRGDVPADTIAVAFLGMIQPAVIIWNLSEGNFDLIGHSRKAWILFSSSIQAEPCIAG